MKPEHTEQYKGYIIEIYPDSDYTYDQDHSAFLVGWSNRYLYVLPPDSDAGTKAEDIIDYYKDTHWLYLLEAYVHSGLVLSLANEGNFPDRKWDVINPIGLIAVSKDIWETKDCKNAKKMVEVILDDWNKYLTGDIWGYIIIDKDNNTRSSCWGYFGMEECITDAKLEVDQITGEYNEHKEKN